MDVPLFDWLVQYRKNNQFHEYLGTHTIYNFFQSLTKWVDFLIQFARSMCIEDHLGLSVTYSEDTTFNGTRF